MSTCNSPRAVNPAKKHNIRNPIGSNGWLLLNKQPYDDVRFLLLISRKFYSKHRAGNHQNRDTHKRNDRNADWLKTEQATKYCFGSIFLISHLHLEILYKSTQATVSSLGPILHGLESHRNHRKCLHPIRSDCSVHDPRLLFLWLCSTYLMFRNFCPPVSWRLFRGKKWNSLKQRVDSYSYGNDQLCIGTMAFTICIFLFPTIIFYYIVFLALRLLTLFFQKSLQLLIGYLLVFPAYSFYLWCFGSQEVKKITYYYLDSQDHLCSKMVPLPLTKLVSGQFSEHSQFLADVCPLSCSKLQPKDLLGSILNARLI